MSKKLITVMWAVSIEVEVPDDATPDTLNHWSHEHSEIGARIIEEAASNISWKGGEITAVDDIPADLSPEKFDHEYDPRFDEGGEFYEEANQIN